MASAIMARGERYKEPATRSAAGVKNSGRLRDELLGSRTLAG
jgi:hypothetical protein